MANSLMFSGGLVDGLTMSLIAFSIVVIVIVGLMFMMMGMKHIALAIESFGKKDTIKNEIKKTSVTGDDESELVAVITAAITAATGHQITVLSYSQIQSYAPKVKPSRSPWKFSGRVRNFEGF